MEFDESLLVHRTNDLKLTTEAVYKGPMTLHCQQCNTVLGDSLGICGEMKCLDSILCLRVTDAVVVSESRECGHKGEMAHCIYSNLTCGICRGAVGRVIHSAPSHLATVRSLFLLYKANILCFILNSCSMVKASTLTFDLKPLSESMNKVKKQFEAQLDQISHIKSRLADRSVRS